MTELRFEPRSPDSSVCTFFFNLTGYFCDDLHRALVLYYSMNTSGLWPCKLYGQAYYLLFLPSSSGQVVSESYYIACHNLISPQATYLSNFGYKPILKDPCAQCIFRVCEYVYTGWCWHGGRGLVKHICPSAISGAFQFDESPHSLHALQGILNGYLKKYNLNFTVKSEKSKQLNATMETDMLDNGWGLCSDLSKMFSLGPSHQCQVE